MKQPPPSSPDLRKLALSFGGGIGFTILFLIFCGRYLDAQLNTGTKWTAIGAYISIALLIVGLFSFVVTILRRGQ